MPGSGHLLSGQTLYLKLRQGGTIDDFVITLPDGRIAGGMKMANGTNSIRTPGGPFPGTRAKSASLVREQFVKAQEYRDKVRAAGDDATKKPARDLAMEALVEVLDGKRIVHFHTHRHDDILTVLRLAEEFGFKLVLQHVSEGWKVADEIARAGVPASIIMIDSPGGKLETVDVAFKTGGVLEKAGVNVGFHTDDYITDSRLFLRSAGMAVRAGMSRDKALYAMTMAGARMLGPRQPHRLARGGQGRRLHRPVRRPAERLHARRADLGGRREGVRPRQRRGPAGRRRRLRRAARRGDGFGRRRGGTAMTCRVPRARCCGAVLRCGVPGAGCGARAARVPVSAQVAVRGETVHTMAGAPIKDGVVLIGKDGKIERVGPAASVSVPAGYRLLRAKVVTPGLVDAHTVVGLAGYLNQPHDQMQLEPRRPSSPSCAPSTPTTRARRWWSGSAFTASPRCTPGTRRARWCRARR